MVKTYVVGRSPYADIVIADPSVAEHHAEITVSRDDRLYLTDCGTGAGTWRRRNQDRAVWEAVRQIFVQLDDLLRLGDFESTPGDLLPLLSAGAQGSAPSHAPGPGNRPGRVERDPLTGEILRRRP